MATTPKPGPDWVEVNGGWVPPNHPLAKSAGAQQPGGSTYQPAALGPNPVNPNALPQQAANAQTYSQTPGAAPGPYTGNQGAQDVTRNSYIARATAPVTVDRNSAAIRQPTDAYAAQQDRAKSQYLSEAAERLSAQGKGTSGDMDVERRMASERAGQATGSFESLLIQRDLERQYSEKSEALEALRGIISADQAAALQRELAQIESALKRESIGATTGLGERELALKDKLGSGALGLDIARLDWTTSPLNPANWG